MRQKRINISDLARESGVSISTISRVINHTGTVKASTVTRVKKVIKRLNCNVAEIRRGQRNGPTPFTIQLLTNTDQDQLGMAPLVAKIIMELSRAASAAHCKFELSGLVSNRHPDGIISYFPPDGFEETGIPRVCIMPRNPGKLETDCVMPDHAAIGRIAYRRLRELGCQSLCFMAPVLSAAFEERWKSFKNCAVGDGCEVHSLIETQPAPPHVALHSDSEYFYDVLNRLAARFQELDPRPDGLFLPNDILAVKTYITFQKLGLSLVKDIRVVSVDNEREVLSLMPHLPDTIDLQPAVLARSAIRLLLKRIKDPGAPTRSVEYVKPILCELGGQ